MVLDPPATRAYVLGSLSARGSAHQDLNARVRRALRWFREIVGRGGRGVPFAIVYDLGFLLLEGDAFPFRSLVDLASWPADERETRLAYENRLLNALLHDPSVRRAIEAVAREPARDELVSRAIYLVLSPLLDPGVFKAPDLNTHVLRELDPRGPLEPDLEAARWDELVSKKRAHLEELRVALAALIARTGDRAALGPEDLSELENWGAYKSEAQRLAGRLIAARAAALPPFDPRRARVAEEPSGDDTELPDAGYYPEGGFSELANRGSLENLVPSELLYFGEDAFESVRGKRVPDLFALRYLERETLFYKRDSGQLARVRRAVHVAIAPDPGLRLKLPWHGDSLAVCLYGLAVRLAADLDRVFARDALHLAIRIIAEGHGPLERAREDRELLRVLLRHEIARGAASVWVNEPELDLRALGERGRRVYGIAVQTGDLAPAGLPAQPAAAPKEAAPPRVVVLKVGGAPPPPRRRGARREIDPGPPVVFLPTQSALEEPLVAARDDLVNEITGMGRL
jgi:hypothetical protein